MWILNGRLAARWIVGEPRLYDTGPSMVKRLTDKTELRRRLETDRAWSLYALADLDDGLFEHCDWWSAGHALVLVFRALKIRPIFAMGGAPDVREALEHMPDGNGYLNLRPEHLEAARGVYRYRERHEVLRMIVEDFKPRAGAAETLGLADCAEIERLYATGDGGGVAFAPFQLETGFFRGIRRDGELVAVAGVQVVSAAESVAAVGNIFTRPDCRGQGLAQVTASAVTMALREAGIRTIGLNVRCANRSAVRAYERIGFAARLTYYEGEAERVAPGLPAAPGQE